MNEIIDPLESELSALSPHQPSRELEQRISERLAQDAARPRHTWLVPRTSVPKVLAVAALLAACALIAIFLPRRAQRQNAAAPVSVSPEPSLESALNASLPTAWQFHRGLNASSSEIDALLDRHVTRAPAHDPEYTNLRGFGRFDTTLSTSPGEL